MKKEKEKMKEDTKIGFFCSKFCARQYNNNIINFVTIINQGLFHYI